MTIKCTGLEFKKFYSDDPAWGEESYHDGLEIRVNGSDEHGDGFDDSVLKDTDTIEILGGYVYIPSSTEGGMPLDKFFRKWKKNQDTETIVVTVDKARLPYLMDAIRGVVSAKVIK